MFLFPPVAWSTGRLVQIIGSALAGGLIATLGPTSAFVINALTFTFSAVMISRVSIPAHSNKIKRANLPGFSGWLHDVQVGLRYAKQQRFVANLLIIQALGSLAVGATSALLVVLAEERLRLSAFGFAWLLGAIGVGALLGPLLFGSLIQDFHRMRYLFLPYIIRGLGDILLGFVTLPPLALFLLFVYGLNTSIGMVVYTSLLQDEVEDVVRGRVYTLLDVVWNTMRLLSLGLGGLLADRFGIEVVYYLGGTLLSGAGLFGLVILREYSFKTVNE